jgi:hypothetical protein
MRLTGHLFYLVSLIRADENKNILRELGAIPLLIEIIQEKSTLKSDDKELAISALTQLALNGTTLLQPIRSIMETILCGINKCCDPIFYLLDINSNLIRESGGISTLMSLLNERCNSSLLEVTIRAINVLCQNGKFLFPFNVSFRFVSFRFVSFLFLSAHLSFSFRNQCTQNHFFEWDKYFSSTV